MYKSVTESLIANVSMQLVTLKSHCSFLNSFYYGVPHLVLNKLSVYFLSLDTSDFDFPLIF
jgi:hypothetical protein